LQNTGRPTSVSYGDGASPKQETTAWFDAKCQGPPSFAYVRRVEIVQQ